MLTCQLTNMIYIYVDLSLTLHLTHVYLPVILRLLHVYLSVTLRLTRLLTSDITSDTC